MLRRRHHRRAPGGLRPMHATRRHDGRACRCESCDSARPARRPPPRDAAGGSTRVELHPRHACARCRGGGVPRGNRAALGTPCPCECGFCDHRRAHLSNGQVRPWPRQSLHARRRWRHAGGVRSRPGTGAARYGRTHGVRSATAMSNPAVSFEPYRRRLLGLAYRMLGSMADAEDAVQETYLRWHGADRDKVSEPRAFLMTTTTRICIDMLTSARARREEYVGPWLPEPVVDSPALAPDVRTELAEDLSIALLLTLDRLSPLERAAFLLHDVFDFSFSEVASALERSEAACRQLAARARTHVRAVRPRGATAAPARWGEIDSKHAQLISAFAAATQSGDLNALMQLLASDVRVVTDGGGKVRAAQVVVDGADRVARFLVNATR